MNRYRVVQPYGRDKARESTVISEHQTAADAFAEIDRLSAQMVRTGAPADAVELRSLTLPIASFNVQSLIN